MIVIKGYRWTVWDILIAISFVAVLGYFALIEISKYGISLASICGSIWLLGTMLFILLYPFPIFGGSVEGEKLLRENKILTGEQAKDVLGRGYHSKISKKVIKNFVLFFTVFGILTMLGVYTNT